MHRLISYVLVCAFGGLLFGTFGACSPARGFCEAHADCSRDFFGIEIPDEAGSAPDSVEVCVVNQEGRVRALRANEEEECHRAADALEIFMACVGDAFGREGDGCDALEDNCEDERDDFQDALQELSGNECTQNED